jgi:hypothetical protein
MNSKLAKEREPALQGQTPDPEQAKAEREKRIQELPPEFQAIIRNRSLNAFEEERRKKMNAMASPNAESSDTQPDSPSPSPTPQ